MSKFLKTRLLLFIPKRVLRKRKTKVSSNLYACGPFQYFQRSIVGHFYDDYLLDLLRIYISIVVASFSNTNASCSS